MKDAWKMVLAAIMVTIWLCCFVWGMLATAQELQIVPIHGLRALDDEQIKDVYSRASYYFKEVGLTFRVKYLPREFNECLSYNTLQTYALGIKCWKNNAYKRGWWRRKLVTYYLEPPMVELDQSYHEIKTWIAGISYICGKVAAGNAVEYSSDGKLRLDQSAVIMAHELMHIFCAPHIESQPNLMHPSANDYTDQFQGKLPILRATKRVVKRRLAELRIKGKKK